MTYPNEALTDICENLLDEWKLTPEQISNLAKDLARECEAIVQDRAKAAREQRQRDLMEGGSPNDSSYRRDIIAADRGHLLGGAS